MKLLIDGDGCPVVGIAIELTNRYHIPCLLLCDTAHEIFREGIQAMVFDKGSDSVDFAIANRVNTGDIVITQDYGLAAMCLTRGARVLHQDGWAYTPDNIDALLLARHEAKVYRASGGRTKGPRKRTRKQDQDFQRALEALLQTTVQG